MYLLDTCTLLWLAGGAKDCLSAKAVQLIREHADKLFVSGISGFEIGLKAAQGKLVLALEPAAWFERAIDHHGLHEIPVHGSVAAASTMLPPIHKDPCDRIIVATAHKHSLTVVTPDTLIASYPGTETIW